jgi:hypothetical protein
VLVVRQVRTNLALVAVLCVLGAALSVYLSTVFRVFKPDSQFGEAMCRLDTTRSDWFVFLVLLGAFIYGGPHLLSLALALTLIWCIYSGRRNTERLFAKGTRISPPLVW